MKSKEKLSKIIPLLTKKNRTLLHPKKNIYIRINKKNLVRVINSSYNSQTMHVSYIFEQL